MTVSFNQIPDAWREPGSLVEVDSSKAQQGLPLLPYKALIAGQKLSTGSAGDNTIHRVTGASADTIVAKVGRGSMLHRQVAAWVAQNKVTDLYIGAVPDDAAGVKAAGTITITGPATGSGTLALYIGGVRVPVAVTSGDAATAIATAVNSAINAATDLPITSAVSSAVVTWTFRHKGLAGNYLDLRVNYNGESYPAGVAAAFASTVTGTTNPTLTSLITAMGDQRFHVVAHPWIDATSMTAIEAEMLDRWGAIRAIPGVAYTSAVGSFATLAALGATRNSGFSVIQGQAGANPLTPPWEYGAMVGAIAAFELANDPARQLNTLAPVGALAPAAADLFTKEERNLLLFTGIGTSKADDPSRTVRLSRVITTYETNAAGSPDTAYLDVTTPHNLMYQRESLQAWFDTKYPRAKLADDDTDVEPGEQVITPKIGRAEAVAWFEALADKKLVENVDQFKRDLVVKRNASDRSRLDFLIPPTLIGQFQVGAFQIQFRL